MSRCTSPSFTQIWSSAVLALPDEQMKFALNAAVDVLPHNLNLHRRKKRNDPSCPLFHSNQSLLHVLNNCPVARNARRYNHHHDLILEAIAAVIRTHLPPSATLTADLSTTYTFPLHIISTDLRPDLVWWDEVCKSLRLAELTVCFETNFDEAARRKSAKYFDLVEQAQAKGYDTKLITIEVGSRGVPHLPGFEDLASDLGLQRSQVAGGFRQACVGRILQHLVLKEQKTMILICITFYVRFLLSLFYTSVLWFRAIVQWFCTPFRQVDLGFSPLLIFMYVHIEMKMFLPPECFFIHLAPQFRYFCTMECH